MNKEKEIFRHFRPKWFNKNRLTLDNLPVGGISFLFLPAASFGQYNYWIYICPENTPFSASVAVSKLRTAVANEVKPWGKITLGSDPILDEAVKSVLAEEDELPSTVAHQLFKMMLTNFSANHMLDAQMQKTLNTRAEYDEKYQDR